MYSCGQLIHLIYLKKIRVLACLLFEKLLPTGEKHCLSRKIFSSVPGQLDPQFNQATDHAVILLVVISFLFDFIIFALPKGPYSLCIAIIIYAIKIELM